MPSEKRHAIVVAETFFRWCVRRRPLTPGQLERDRLVEERCRDARYFWRWHG